MGAREQVADVGLHAVGHGVGHGGLVEVTPEDPGGAALRHQDGGDGTAPGAQVDGGAAGCEAGHRPLRQGFTLPAWHIDAGCNAQREAAKGDATEDPGQRFAGQASLDHALELRRVTVRRVEKLAGFVVRRHETRARQELGQLGERVRTQRRH